VHLRVLAAVRRVSLLQANRNGYLACVRKVQVGGHIHGISGTDEGLESLTCTRTISGDQVHGKGKVQVGGLCANKLLWERSCVHCGWDGRLYRAFVERRAP